jgi:hypothetical protein
METSVRRTSVQTKTQCLLPGSPTCAACANQGVVYPPCATHNLQLDPLSIELNCPNLKVNSNSGDEGGCPCIITESQQ